MEDYRGQVAIAFDQLVAEGFPLTATTDEEQEKARLTRRAALLINRINRNIGLLSKTSGNNILGLSVDIIIDKTNGDFADIASSRSLGNGLVEILQVWVPKNDPSLISRWVQPTAALAGIPDTPTTEPEPGNPDEITVLTKLEAIDKKLDMMLELQGRLVDVAISFVEKFK